VIFNSECVNKTCIGRRLPGPASELAPTDDLGKEPGPPEREGFKGKGEIEGGGEGRDGRASK